MSLPQRCFLKACLLQSHTCITLIFAFLYEAFYLRLLRQQTCVAMLMAALFKCATGLTMDC